MANTCNQCGKEMGCYMRRRTPSLYYCENPECPNFGLLAIPMEKIKTIKSDSRTGEMINGKDTVC